MGEILQESYRGGLAGQRNNALVMESLPHVEILYSTSKHHKAYGSMTGSQYADTMSEMVKAKTLYWKARAINDKYGHFFYSMHDLQNDLATELVKKNVQTPEYKVIGTANTSFPFVAMHLPTERTLYMDDAVVEIIED